MNTNYWFSSGASGGDDDYKIARSLRFNSADDAYLERNISSKNSTYTISFWIKRSKLTEWQYPWSQTDGSGYSGIGFTGDDRISIYNGDHSYTTAVFRDTSAWYHLCLKVSAGIAILYVNNQEVATTPYMFFGGGTSKIGNFITGIHPLNGYLAEFYGIEGQALDPTDFGKYDDNGVWKAKEFEGSFVLSNTTDEVYAWKATTSNANNSGGWYFTQEDGFSSLGLPGATGGHPDELGGNTLGARTGEGDIGVSGTFSTANGNSNRLSMNGAFTQNTSTRSFVYNRTVNKVWVHNGSSWLGGGNPANTSSTPTFFVPSTGKLSFGIIQNTSLEGLTLAPIDSSIYSGTATEITFRGSYNNTTLSTDKTNAICSGGGYSDAWSIELLDNSTGSESYYLDFSDNSSNAALGTDSSGNGNNWTVNNLIGLVNPDVSIANATGALPIRNTTGTYGGTVAPGNRTDSQIGLQLAMPLRNALNDESGNSYTITNTGVTFTTNHSKFYGQSSAFFNSNKVNISNASGLGAFGTSDFTIEAYVKFTDNGHNFGRVIEFGSVNNNALTIDGTTAPFRLRYDGNNNSVYGTTGTIPLGKWTHVAAVRSNGTLKFYVDGVEGGSHTFTYNLAGGSAQIGNYLGSQLNFDGYMQDLRVYSSAKYTSNFTPPNNPANGLPGEGLDSLIDTPTNYESDSGNNGGNYCVWNPIDSTGSNTLTNGNLDCSGAQRGNRGTIAVTSGKYYYETVISSFGVGGDFGWSKSDEPCPTTDPGATSYGWSIHTSGLKRHNGSTSACISGGLGVGDVIQFAIDVDAGKVWFGKNNIWGESGNPAAGTNAAFTNVTGPIAPAHGNGGSGITFSTNFGQRPFTFTPPTGYKSLCTTNLPDPAIDDGSTAFDAVAFTGNAASRSITTGFSPDLVWLKNRATTNDHNLFDIIRGANNFLRSNTTDGDSTGTSNRLTAFNSDGFDLGSSAAVNGNGNGIIAWAWDGGTSTVSNTDGSITSSVRANPSAGFSIVSYTGNATAGATIGHGLNAAPYFVILKNRADSGNWIVWHNDLGGGNKILELNTTESTKTTTTPFNGTVPSSSVVTLGTNNGTNGSGDGMIAYCFTPIPGYSAFGSYTGNGNADGPFVYTGFRPRWVMYKETTSSGSGHWNMYDSARSTYNVVDENLQANRSNAEFTFTAIDTVSNGFKLRTSNLTHNHNGGTYIYAAFAEHPFKTARAR